MIHYLSRTNNIPSKDFNIAGLKDKHAITEQYFTIPSACDIKTLKEENFEITFLGYLDNELHRGELLGNRFKITVRDITKGELDGIYKKASMIADIGVPNYYDSQRFGSIIKGVFIGKQIEENHYDEAVKAFLTLYKKSEHKELKKDKRETLNHWDDLSKANVKNKTLNAIINEYLKTKNWKKAYLKIPKHIRELHQHAYESYQWNEKAKNLLKKVKNHYLIKYNAGNLLFYKNLSAQQMKELPKMLDGRQLIIMPSNFAISKPFEDELRPNRYKISISFDLPKGSYATIITKKLFNK